MWSHRFRPGRLQAALVAFLLVLSLMIWQVLAQDSANERGSVETQKQSPQRRSQPGGQVPVIDRLSRQQREAFSLLRSPPEGLPARVTEALHQPSYGMNWRLAQRMPVELPVDFWAVPGRGAICIVGQEKLGVV